MDSKGVENLFRQIMGIWIAPEIERRQSMGMLANPVSLQCAQIIFNPNGGGVSVRLNDEVKAVVTFKIKSGIVKKANEPVYANEVEVVEKICLTDKENPDCGHITLYQFNNIWTIEFDFRTNKRTAVMHLGVAVEFLEAAKNSINQEHWHSFIDNAYSAAELIVKAILLATVCMNKETNHSRIHSQFNLFAKAGNVPKEQKTVFNKLTLLRKDARYLSKPLNMTFDKAQLIYQELDKLMKTSEIFLAGCF